jgi:GTP-binding protein EngB required for normal cell division
MGSQSYEYKFNDKMDEVKDKIAILLGITGVGKSSFINCITKTTRCKVGDDTKSCTQAIMQSDMSKDGYNFYFVDTPGLDDGEGDEKNIAQLNSIKKKYPRINTMIICLKFDDLKLSNSLKKSLIQFMEIFPCHDFWNHVIILRTHAERSSKFEKKKKKIEGKLLEGIHNDKELGDYMKKNGIEVPANLKEFFVDSDMEELDDDTQIEYKNVLNAIKNIYPLYKEVKEEIKEYINELKEGEISFIHILTDKHIKFIDFDGKEHEKVLRVGDEKYNLNGFRPLLVEVKRDQEKEPRGILCWSNQFKTHYTLVKIYEINGERKRVESMLEYRWEYKTEEGEKEGEDYRKYLNDQYNKDICQC